MHIIIEVLDNGNALTNTLANTANGALAQTGILGGGGVLALLVSLLLLGSILLAHKSKLAQKIATSLSVASLLLVLGVSSNIGLNIASAKILTADSTVSITMQKGQEKTSEQNASFDFNLDQKSGHEEVGDDIYKSGKFNVYGKLAGQLPQGLDLYLTSEGTSENAGSIIVPSQSEFLYKSIRVGKEDTSDYNKTYEYQVTAQAGQNVEPGIYLVDIDVYYRYDLDPTDPPVDPPVDPNQPIVANALSTDNGNTASWTNTLTNWAGGDLIVRTDAVHPFNSSDQILIDDEPCTTTGQGFINLDETDARLGCVLPNMEAGEHTVYVNGFKYGTITYNPVEFNMSTDNGTAAKASMKQGEVRILTDTRDGKEYRVKKMPDGKVWMVDNLAYDITEATSGKAPAFDTPPEEVECTDYSTGDGCIASVITAPQFIKLDEIPGYTPTDTATTHGDDYGYLYNWCAATADTSEDCDTSSNLQQNNEMPTSISPEGFRLPTGGDDGEFMALASKMKDESVTNPVYATGDPSDNEGQNNWNSRTTSPFLGSLSGSYFFELQNQDIGGSYWSSTAASGEDAYLLGFNTSSVAPAVFYYRLLGSAVRSVL